MNRPVASHSVILKAGKQLGRIASILMLLEVAVALWMVKLLLTPADLSGIQGQKYNMAFLHLPLALCLLFLLYRFRKTLPKNKGEALLVWQTCFIKPILLRVLLTIQLLTLLIGMYSTATWMLFDTINLFYLSTFSEAFSLTIFLAQHAIVMVGVAFLVQLIRLNSIVSSRHTKETAGYKVPRTYRYATLPAIAIVALLTWQLIPVAADLIVNADSLLFLGQLSFLILPVKAALAILLAYAAIALLRKKSAIEGRLYGWIVTLTAIDLYVSILTNAHVSLILQYPDVVLPVLLCAVFEVVLLVLLTGTATYSSILLLSEAESSMLSERDTKLIKGS